VVRLAAKTAFDFNRGTRGLNLKEGAVLVQAPKEANGATIHAGGVAAAVAGTTVMIEYHPGFYKFLVLEGTARSYRPGHVGDSVLVRAGQMVFGDPETALSDPVDVDIDRFMTTSRFITDFPPLRSQNPVLAGRRSAVCFRSTTGPSAGIPGNPGRAVIGSSWSAASCRGECQSHPGNGSAHGRGIARGTDLHRSDVNATRCEHDFQF